MTQAKRSQSAMGRLQMDNQTAVPAPNGQPRRCVDSRKAFEEFGFKSKTSLEEGLKKTIEWFEDAQK